MSSDAHDLPQDASPFARWSRLKAEARRRGRGPVAPAATSTPLVERTERPAECPTSGPVVVPAEQRTGADVPVAPSLPDLAELGENSDYSAFLGQGVDAALRRRALRQLFGAPKFNVCDGLDTYIDDFRSFPELGTVVTADMRHHVERLARRAADEAERATHPVASTATAPSPTATPPPAEAEASTESSDATPQESEFHGAA